MMINKTKPETSLRWGHQPRCQIGQGLKGRGSSGPFTILFPSTSCAPARSTPIFKLVLHFDLNYTPVKFCNWILHGADKICPQTDIHICDSRIYPRSQVINPINNFKKLLFHCVFCENMLLLQTVFPHCLSLSVQLLPWVAIVRQTIEFVKWNYKKSTQKSTIDLLTQSMIAVIFVQSPNPKGYCFKITTTHLLIRAQRLDKSDLTI